jgi:carbon storage regulator CsrA
MLVLSRKPGEKVLFPDFQAAVQVLAVNGQVVRLGIGAPPGVTVLREELLRLAPGAPGSKALPGARPGRLPRELAHQLRNRLQSALVGLATLRRQRDLGLVADAEATLDLLADEVEAMRCHLDGAERAAAPAPAPAARRRALLVEDDSNERELLAGFLRVAGLEVATASDGADALDYLRGGGRADFVLLDMGLPRCDGATTVREIRRHPDCASLKVFAVTGRSQAELPGDAAASVNRWFRKPVNPEDLLREVNRELEERP